MHAMQCLVPILRGALHSVQRKVNVLAERTDREVGMIHSHLLGEYSAAHPVHRNRIHIIIPSRRQRVVPRLRD